MANPRIIVTGANGQLGKELREASKNYPQFNFVFLSREELPVENQQAINDFFCPQTCVLYQLCSIYGC